MLFMQILSENGILFQWQSHGYHSKSFKISSAFKNLSLSKISFCHQVEKVSHVLPKIRVKTMLTVLAKEKDEQWRNDLAKMWMMLYMHFLNLSMIISQRRFFIRNLSIGISETTNCKVGCVILMVVVSILPHAEFGPNDHQKDASDFKTRIVKF